VVYGFPDIGAVGGVQNFGKGFYTPTDGTPYVPWTLGDLPTNSSAGSYNSAKTWNGRFVDWYWSTHQTTTFGAKVLEADLLNTFGGNSSFITNPWLRTNDTGTPSFDMVDAAYFRLSNINAMGYDKLQKGWWQIISNPEGGNANGYGAPGDYFSIPVTVPHYFDTVVWRSFGEDAWNRNVNFQWRVTPYYNNGETGIAPPTDASFNTFVIEIMFDKPIHVSGARRWGGPTGALPGTVDYNDNAVIPVYETNTADVATWWGAENGVDSALATTAVDCSARCRTQRKFFANSTLPDTTPAAGGTEFKPYGQLQLRGQAMLSYRKVYTPAS
jgi:hypothetical protein